MALLPDLRVASLLALGAFLLLLGLLVVFVDSIPLTRVIAVGTLSGLLAVLLAWLGEPGLGLVVVGIGGAVVASQVFEWLAAR